MEKLRLCYVHNVPNNPVFIDVDSVKQAIDTKEVIANVMLDLQENNQIPGPSNVMLDLQENNQIPGLSNVMLDLQENNQIPGLSNIFWLEVFEDDEWLEWTNEDGELFDEVSEL